MTSDLFCQSTTIILMEKKFRFGGRFSKNYYAGFDRKPSGDLPKDLSTTYTPVALVRVLIYGKVFFFFFFGIKKNPTGVKYSLSFDTFVQRPNMPQKTKSLPTLSLTNSLVLWEI